MAKQATEAASVEELTVLADRGYFSGEEIVACEAVGATPIVPKPLTSGAKADGRFDKPDFIYQPETDSYRCPAGEQLIWRFTAVEKGLTLSRYWSSNCGSCAIKAKCTPSKQRRIIRWEHEAVLEKMQRRLDAGRDANQAQHRRARLRQSQRLDGKRPLPNAAAAACRNGNEPPRTPHNIKRAIAVSALPR